MSELDYSYLPPESEKAPNDETGYWIAQLALLKIQQFMDEDTQKSGWDTLFPMDDNDIDALERYAG